MLSVIQYIGKIRPMRLVTLQLVAASAPFRQRATFSSPSPRVRRFSFSTGGMPARRVSPVCPRIFLSEMFQALLATTRCFHLPRLGAITPSFHHGELAQMESVAKRTHRSVFLSFCVSLASYFRLSSSCIREPLFTVLLLKFCITDDRNVARALLTFRYDYVTYMYSVELCKFVRRG